MGIGRVQIHGTQRQFVHLPDHALTVGIRIDVIQQIPIRSLRQEGVGEVGIQPQRRVIQLLRLQRLLQRLPVFPNRISAQNQSHRIQLLDRLGQNAPGLGALDGTRQQRRQLPHPGR